MTTSARTTAIAAQAPADEPAPGLDPARLAAANINPATGLASDYLNHFNEAIMMLELVPDFVEDLKIWRPMSYREHFATSHFTERDLAIRAYENAEPQARRRLDELADVMNTILLSTSEAMRRPNLRGVGALARAAARELRPLVARAGAVINGAATVASESAEAGASQAAVDALFERGG